LGREDIDDYLKLEFPEHSFPVELAALIHGKTEGSPLFMADLVRYLRDQKVISQTDGNWALAQTVPDVAKDLPESMRSMIQRKIDQLSDDDKKLLMAASVQGYEFDSAVLADVLDIHPDELEDRLETYERVHSFVQLVDEKEFPDLTLTLRYRFVHVLYQNVLYASIRPTRKAALSASVANDLISHYRDQSSEIASELAFLFKTGRDFRRAASYFLLAGTNAARVYANQEAIVFYQAAAEMIEQQMRAQSSTTSEESIVATEVYESLGKILAITGRHEEARAVFGKALDNVGEDRLWQARLNRAIGGTWLAQRQTTETLKALDASEDDLKMHLDQQSQAWWHEFIQVQLERMWVFYWLAEIQHLNDLTSETGPLIEQHGSQTQRGKFFYMLMLYRLRRDRYAPKEATVKYAEAALTAIEGSDDVGEVTAIQFGTGFAFLWLGNLDLAEKQMTKALLMARRRGDSLNQVLCLTYLTIIHRKRGDLDKVADYNLQAMETATAARMSPYIAMARANRAWIAWRHGDYSTVRADALAALELWQQDQGSYAFQWAAICPLISVSLTEKKISEAIEYARMLFKPPQQLLPSDLSKLVEQAIAAWERDDVNGASTLLHSALKLAEELKYL
jgi:tetratricopeptide (TPR) repeat protein